MPPKEPDADELEESSRESVEKAQSLVDDMRAVAEYEKNLLEQTKPTSKKARASGR